MSSENPKKNNLLTEMRDLMYRLHYYIHTETAHCDCQIHPFPTEIAGRCGAVRTEVWRDYDSVSGFEAA